MIFAAISLLPSFNSQDLSKQALELAQWTALKDYIDKCHSAADSGTISPECNEALSSTLPPPPHVKLNSSTPLISRALAELFERHETYLPLTTPRWPLAPQSILVLGLLLILVLSTVFFIICALLESKRKTMDRGDEERIF
ncbi:unnamed protein product, partial [Clonostachys rosea]